MRVVTWNIRAGIGPGEPFPPAWWRHVRDDRLERIASTLLEIDPDVAGLQEVWATPRRHPGP
jgi:endonuclease/exonuclease/phosphatase family metal-dependent hydrolase